MRAPQFALAFLCFCCLVVARRDRSRDYGQRPPPFPDFVRPPHTHSHAPDSHLHQRFRQTMTTATKDPIDAMQPTTADLVKSVYDLVAQKRDANVMEMSNILQKKVEAEKEQSSLNQRVDELKTRAAMLTRLQYCLEMDAASKNAQLVLADLHAANLTSGLMTPEQIQQKQRELDELKKAIEDLKKKLGLKEKELDEREERLRKRITAVRKAEEELEARAADPHFGGLPKHKNSTRSTTCPIHRCPGDCALHQDCSSCVEDPKCGWCRTTQSCMSVLPFSRTPAGNCSSFDFNYLFCKANTCPQHRTCRQCMSDPECGRCTATGSCAKGTLSGPETGACPTWNFATPFRLFSLNVYGKDPTNTTARSQLIFDMVEEANADFLLFQEVEDWFLEELSKKKWAKSYHASDFGSGHAPGGLLILSKIPLLSVMYYEKTQPGQVEVDQRGRLLTVRPKIGQGLFLVATTTLDWRSSVNRADSLEFIFSVLNTTSDVVLAGDLNFDFGSQPESSQLPPRFKDVWLELRPERPGFSWDPFHNMYARSSDPKSRPSRIDRMLVASDYALFTKITKVGSSDVSPHYGLLADMLLPSVFC